MATLYQESEWKSLLLVLSLLLGLSSLLVLRRLWSPSWWTESHGSSGRDVVRFFRLHLAGLTLTVPANSATSKLLWFEHSAGFSRFRHPNLDCFLQAPPSRIRSTQWQVVQVAHARHPRRNACGAMSPCPALCSWTLSGPLNQKLRHQHPAGGFTTMSQSQAQVCSSRSAKSRIGRIGQSPAKMSVVNFMLSKALDTVDSFFQTVSLNLPAGQQRSCRLLLGGATNSNSASRLFSLSETAPSFPP